MCSERTDAERATQIYGDYIRQIEAEDRLIASRLQLTLTFQGFLFASFGLSTLETNISAQKFAAAAPYLGMLTAALGFIGVLAAQRSANKKRKEWEKLSEASVPARSYFLSGKVEWYASALATLGLPLVILVFWILMALPRLPFTGN
jgi:hypothetical protein